MQKGSISGRKIKKEHISCMKYIKEVQQHATFLPTAAIPRSTADILVLLTSLSGSFVIRVSVSTSCPFNTW